jgi:hypothetical protein
LIHDQNLLERLDAFSRESFVGEVYRTTRVGLDPLTPSVAGGRWSLKDDAPTLYTSLDFDGSVAEMAFHLSQLIPIPRKPVVVNTLGVETRNTLRLLRGNLNDLGVNLKRFGEVGYLRTREIGAAVAFLDCDGLIVPSARWECENLALFPLNQRFEDRLELVDSYELDWIVWAEKHKMEWMP